MVKRNCLRGGMDQYHTDEAGTGVRGASAPADGNSGAGVAPGLSPASREGGEDAPTSRGATTPPTDLGANNERLEDVKPELAHALRELVRQYRQEGSSRDVTKFAAFARRASFGRACNTPGGIPTT